MFNGVPQIQTIIDNKGVSVTSVIDAPWVSVTSINGMTGDVTVQPVIEGFKPRFPYVKGNIITHNEGLYVANDNFTSGDSFDSSDWTRIEASSIDWGSITNKPNFATVATSGLYSDLSGTPNLATVATSGLYSDLSGTPNLASVATSGSYNDLTNRPALASVATSGAYSDLSGLPTIGAGQLTITSNNASMGTFGANSVSDATIEIPVPTATNQLENNSGFITMTDNLPLWSGLYWSGTGASVGTQTIGLPWTTKRGQELTYGLANGGTILGVYEGAENVQMFRQYWCASFSPGVDGNYGVHHISSGTYWTRVYGKARNGNLGGMGEESFTGEGPSTWDGTTLYYGNLAATDGGTKTSTQCSITGIRTFPGSVQWRIFGKIASAGVLTTLSFDSQLTTPDAGILPTVYQRGASSENTGVVAQYIEVLETE